MASKNRCLWVAVFLCLNQIGFRFKQHAEPVLNLCLHIANQLQQFAALPLPQINQYQGLLAVNTHATQHMALEYVLWRRPPRGCPAAAR